MSETIDSSSSITKIKGPRKTIRKEGQAHGFKNIDLFVQTWVVEKAKGTIILTHGVSEHSDCYNDFAHRLNGNGFNVFAFDLRGHGRSSGQRGFVNSFDEFEKDLRCIIEVAKREMPGPYFLFGHSMGGLICLKNIIAYGDQGLSGLILSAPALGISVPIPYIKEQAAGLLAQLIPRLTLYNELKPELLIHDKKKQEDYKKDPYRHEKVSPKLFLGLKEGFGQVLEHIEHIQLPLLLQIPKKDGVVSSPAARKFFKQLVCKDKQLFEYPNSFHEIYIDLENDMVFADLFKFLSERI